MKDRGLRRLLRFDTAIENIGKAGLFLGAPESNPIAHHSSCHGHFHYDGIALYELLDLDESDRLLQRREFRLARCLAVRAERRFHPEGQCSTEVLKFLSGKAILLWGH